MNDDTPAAIDRIGREGGGTRLQIEFDLVPHGFGYLFAWLARRQARKTIPRDLQNLKARLESGPS